MRRLGAGGLLSAGTSSIPESEPFLSLQQFVFAGKRMIIVVKLIDGTNIFITY
jgi:hypothetical protein